MEIGGYLELESFRKQPYYPDLYAVNFGRTALTWLLQALKCTTLFVPYFLCDSVTEKCELEGYKLSYYYVDEQLTPLLEAPLPTDSYLYLVNHYGQLTDEKIQQYKKQYMRIIVDHTHSFFQRPLEGIPTLYSCRKFFGVSDGAYLYSDIALPLVPDRDISKDRMEHLLGRMEGNASDYYHILHQNAKTFSKEPIKRMSKLTANILGAIDYEQVRSKRNENYHTLHHHLNKYNPLDFIAADGPLAYPFYHPQGLFIRKELARRKIYVPAYWKNVMASMPEDSVEYRYAANILALPCDQRYTSSQMELVSDILLSLLKKYGVSHL